MIKLILEIMGKDVNRYTDWLNFVTDRKGHDMRYAMNADKIYNELGWKARTNIIHGLEKTLEWYL